MQPSLVNSEDQALPLGGGQAAPAGPGKILAHRTSVRTERRPSLRNRIARATSWTFVGAFASQGVSAASSLVLTRLLLPETYGIMELAFVFYTGLYLFSDVGLEPSIIQSPLGDEPRFLNTAWTIQVIRGGLLLVVSFGLGHLASDFYDIPQLVFLIPGLGLTAVLDGFGSMAVHTRARHMDLGPLVRLDLLAQVLAVIAQVAAALVWPSPWALVLGSWVRSGTKTVGSHLYLARHRHRFDWDPRAAQELFGFARWIFGSTALTFVSSQGDRLLLPHYSGDMAAFGVYAIAGRFKNLAQTIHTKLIRSVLFPVLAERYRELASSGDDFRPELSRLYYRLRLALDAVFVTGAGVLLGAGGVIIELLYPPDYHLAGAILQIFAVEVAMAAALVPAEAVLTALGETKHWFYRSLGRALFVVIGIPIGWHVAGFWGVVWAVALSEIPTVFVQGREMLRHGLLRPTREALALAFFCLGCLLGHGISVQLS